ncbi:Centromere/kinetochore Zw10-domain-containing protein [Zychaea mexicana]|uniref:Centromere/kinetochore Zw10-domain-containing protein n=1 Tax=Zychaea mexicana TaxID=64656 RepID=UPI0022FE7683|nr:Centromere/kinetochore Zw10-domain-containing protein [Zychaea mexicana]KAI9490533.1 Centromere/kinetochore Zw10-domain-containing protein [Zychaea mexicana]
MSTETSANNNSRIQQDFITAIFNDNADRDALLQNQHIDNRALVSTLNGLEDHTHILQQQVFETVRDNLDSFVSLYTGCHQVHERLDGILDQCQNLGGGSSIIANNHEQQQKITDVLHKYQETIRRTTQNQNEIQVLERIQRLVQEMDDCEQQLLGSPTTPVQDVTRQYLTIHDALSKEEEHLSKENESVTRLLREQYTQLRDKLVTTLQDKMAEAVVFATPDPENTRTMCVYPTGTASKHPQLLDIFECFDMLDILSAEMANLKRSIMKNIVTPFFDYCSTAHISIQGNTLYSQRHGQNDGEDSHADIACAVLHNIDTMLKFISEQCFDGLVDKTKTRLFGNLILPEIFQQLIQYAIAPAIPSSAAQLATFDSVANAVREVEHNCIQQYGFLSDDNGEPSSITVYVDNVDSHFATKRRDKVLLEGRRVMLRQLYEVEDIVDMDTKTNTLQQYQITQTPKLLSLLLIDTVKEANNLRQQGSHPVSVTGLLGVVYDLLDLYRAIMPQFHRSQFLSSPQSALVFRNDCYWLANSLTKDLVSTVQNDGTTDLSEKLQGAVDNVRTLGESWFELAMAQWVRVLHKALDKTKKFVGIAENRQQQQACDEAIAQVIDQIRSYAVTLRTVISERVYFDLVSRVVDSVLTHLMGDIEDLQDIGADDSHLIAQSLNSLIQLVDVFDSSQGQPATEPQVMQRVPSWRKFWFLKDMLEMNLRDIMDHYRRGELYTFEKKELIHLICALFADTDLRASMIREIQTTSPPPPSMLSPTTTSSSSPSPSVEQHRSASPFTPQKQQPQDEKPLTPKTSSLAMVSQEDNNEGEEGGDGWGWDDEPIIPSQHVERREDEKKQQQPRTTSSLSMMDHDAGAADGWGFNDDDEPMVIPQEQPKDLTKKKTSLSMELDDNDEQEEGGWGDDDEPLIIPQESDNKEHKNERKADDDEKSRDVPKKTRPLSMLQLDDVNDEEEQGWGLDDNEPLTIPQEHQEEQQPSMMQLDNVVHGKQASKASSETDTAQPAPVNIQQEKEKESTSKKTNSSLSMAQTEEGNGWGWDDADEDVNWNNLH